MARGWESKSVEQQQDEAQAEQQRGHGRSPERAEQIRTLQGLQLSHSRVLKQLESAINPRHREMLKAALTDLERKISEVPKN